MNLFTPPPNPKDQAKQQQHFLTKIKEQCFEKCYDFTDNFLYCVQKKGSFEGCEKTFKKHKNCLSDAVGHIIPQLTSEKEDGEKLKQVLLLQVIQPESTYTKDNIERELGNLDLKCWSSLKKVSTCTEMNWFGHKRQGHNCRKAYKDLIECAGKSYNIDTSKFTKCWKNEMAYDDMSQSQVIDASKKCFPLADEVVKRFSEKKENLSL